MPSSLEERNSHSQHVSTQTNVNIIQDVQSGNKERAQTLQVFVHIVKSYILISFFYFMLVVSRQILGIFMARSEQGRVERFKQKG